MTDDHHFEPLIRKPRTWPEARSSQPGLKEFGSVLAEGFAKIKETNPHFEADWQRSVGLIIGAALLRRKLRKLGFSKKEIFIAQALLGNLARGVLLIDDIRTEVRKQTALLEKQTVASRHL